MEVLARGKQSSRTHQDLSAPIISKKSSLSSTGFYDGHSQTQPRSTLKKHENLSDESLHGEKQNNDKPQRNKKSKKVREADEKRIPRVTRKIVKERKSSLRRVDDEMNHKHLMELEKQFMEGSTDDKGLSLEQFRSAMKMILSDDVDDDELDRMFMRVDTNCDGTVDWDEYLTYMLLEFQGRKQLLDTDLDSPYPYPISHKTSNHLESICSVRMMKAASVNRYANKQEAEGAASRYVTVSREGVLNIWNINWVLQKSTLLDGARGSAASNVTGKNVGRGLSVTDMVCMANCNSLAVATTDYEISFYTITSDMIKKRFQIKGAVLGFIRMTLENWRIKERELRAEDAWTNQENLQCFDLAHSALTMDYSYDAENPKRSILLWGDTSGSIVIMRFYENPNMSLFSTTVCSGNKIPLVRLISGHVQYVTAVNLKQLHSDWVQQVRYYVNKKGQECLLSGCVSEDSSLVFADITERGTENIFNKKTEFRVRKGVHCLAYDPDWNLIVTGSRDCNVRVWNTFVATRSAAVLKGHKSAVLRVEVRNFDHMVISISKDKNVRIWDLHDYTCKQNIRGRFIDLGRQNVSATYVCERRAQLVIATNRIGVMSSRHTSVAAHRQRQATSHTKPIVQVLYNPVFDQLVTGGEDSMVCLWDISTGQKVMQFRTGKDGQFTSMAFDPTNRRLLTGRRKGGATLWNFNNGARLRRLRKMDDEEISDVVFARQRIVTGGWNKHLCVYLDSYTTEEYTKLKKKHNDDIQSLDYHRQDAVLASASYDGDIFIWSLDAGEVTMTLNMYVSILPIRHEKKKKRAACIQKTRQFGEKLAENATPRSSLSTQPDKKYKSENADSPRRSTLKLSAKDEWLSASDSWLPSDLPWLKQTKASHQESDTDGVSDNDSVTSEWESGIRSSASFIPSDSDDADKERTTPKLEERPVYKLLFLQSRRCEENIGNLVAAGTSGWICTWSSHPLGAMLGYFQACKKRDAGDFVTTMARDKHDRLLVTGDTRGYIRVWDIAKYCNGQVSSGRNPSISPYRTDALSSDLSNEKFNQQFMPTSIPPDLKVSIRGHMKSVTSLACIDGQGLIASGSVDGSVRLWTNNGRYVGTFGQSVPWSIDHPLQESELPSEIPHDVRRVASKTTLWTIKGKVHPQWKQVKNAVNMLAAGKLLLGPPSAANPKKRMSPVTSVMRSSKKRTHSIHDMLDAVSNTLLEEASMSSVTAAEQQRRGSVTVWMGDEPHAIISRRRSRDEVEETYRRIEKHGMKSSILGKINYKPKHRHRQSKINTEIRWCNNEAVIYRALPYARMVPLEEPQLPEHIRRQRERAFQRRLVNPNPIAREITSQSRRKSKDLDAGRVSRATTVKSEMTERMTSFILPPLRKDSQRNEHEAKLTAKRSVARSSRHSTLVTTLPSIA